MDTEILAFYKRKFQEPEQLSYEVVHSFGCCKGVTYREHKREDWKRLFTECLLCLGRKTLVGTGGVTFFLCLPCVKRIKESFE